LLASTPIKTSATFSELSVPPNELSVDAGIWREVERKLNQNKAKVSASLENAQNVQRGDAIVVVGNPGDSPFFEPTGSRPVLPKHPCA